MRPEDIDPDEPAIPGVELKGGDATWRRYAGKVIAVGDGEVRAWGETWGACIAAAKRAGVSFESVEFLFVPGGVLVG